VLFRSGEEKKNLYSGKQQEGIYNPEGGTIQEMPSKAPAVRKATSLAERIEFGKQVYTQTCFACHQAEGQGIPNAFPPLANSDYLNANVNRAIKIILEGKTGEIIVNGVTYNSIMTAQTLTDEEIANVLTYVFNSWDNSKKEVKPSMVAKMRSTH